MLCPARYPRSRSPWAMGSKEANPNELDSSDKYPTLGTFIGGCASAARGTASRLRMSMTIHPTVLHHMIVSSRQLYADLLLSMEAEPLIHVPFHHANMLLAWYLGSFAPCLLSTLQGAMTTETLYP